MAQSPPLAAAGSMALRRRRRLSVNSGAVNERVASGLCLGNAVWPIGLGVKNTSLAAPVRALASKSRLH